MTLFSSWFWPDVNSRKNALFAISEAFYVMLAVASLLALFAFVDFARAWKFDDRLWGFVEAVFLAATAIGIRHKSRVAAVLGFTLYVVDRVGQWVATGHPGGLLLTIVVALALLHGVRGTFALHRFAPLPANMPSIEQSFRSFLQTPPQGEKDAEQK
jgi:hypothetical protein